MKEIETTVHNAKTHLSKYLAMLERREIERVIIKRRDKIVSQISLPPEAGKPELRFGTLKGKISSFDKKGADREMKNIWNESDANAEKDDKFQ